MNTTETDDPKRQERAQRILDAAAELILRWGYNKTTVDDISRQAGVAKGTIYLHWKTREALFAALMKREKLALAEDFRQRIAADPAGSTLRGMLRHSALALMGRPLLKAVLLRDMDVIGRMAQTDRSSDAYAEKVLSFKTYLEFLREYNLVRQDLSLRAEVYIVSAIFMGFFLIAPLVPDDIAHSDEEIAELMAETVHCTLEAARPLSAEEIPAVAQALMVYTERDTASAQTQFQQAVDS